MLETPVLFLIFNRPALTAQVFKRIRAARPRQLFVAADGPRANHLKDKVLCIETRKIVEQIDWDCEVKTFFRTENIGVGRGVSESITWFFDHVEEGIILEDDCVPDMSFFPFCAKMLEKYRNEPQVWQIAGTNYLFGQRPDAYSYPYYFSMYNSIWGWATWKRAWQHFDIHIPTDYQTYMPIILHERIKNAEMEHWLLKAYQTIMDKSVDTWDTQWSYHFNYGQALCVTPVNNLVKNIGIDGSHFSYRTPYHNMSVKSFPFNHLRKLRDNCPPLSIQHNIDALIFPNILRPKWSLLLRLRIKIEKIFS